MKKSTWVLILILLAALLVYGFVQRGGVVSGYTYSEANRYNVGGGEVKGNVKHIDLSWIAGSVNIEYHNGREISVSEMAGKILKADEQLRWRVDGDTLIVKYMASGFRTTRDLNKELTVLLPESLKLEKAEISVVSADLKAEDLVCDELHVNSVSGSADLEVAEAKLVDADTVSGPVRLTAKRVDKLDAAAVSGDLRFTFDRMPEKIEADAISGSVEINLPENAGVTVDFDTVSGDLHDALGMTMVEKGRYVSGNGECRIDVDTTSGDLRLNGEK